MRDTVKRAVQFVLGENSRRLSVRSNEIIPVLKVGFTQEKSRNSS